MSMTITVDVGVIRIAYDLLDDAGVADIEAVLDTMLDVVRSERFCALVSASASVSASTSASTSDSTSFQHSLDSSADLPDAASSGDVYEFVALRKSDRGELRAVAMSGKYSKYGMSLGDLRDEYLRRAGLSASAANALVPGSHVTHRTVTMRVDPAGASFLV